MIGKIGLSVLLFSFVTFISVLEGQANYAPTLTGGNRPLYIGTLASLVPWVEDLNLWDTYTFQILSQPVYGSASVVNNKLVYTPAVSINAIDNFTYQATDHDGATISGTEAVRIYPSTNLNNCKRNSTVYSSGVLATRTIANWCTFYSISNTRLTETGTPVTMDYFINWPSSGTPAKAIIVLIGGGDLNMGLSGNTSTGVAASTGGGNFVVRSSQIFADAGYITIAIDKPSDQPPVGSTDSIADADQYRISVKHAVDILTILKHINTENLNVFIAGTSRGAISAVALNLMAAGISLSSPLTSDPNDDHVYIGKPGVSNLQPAFVDRPAHVLWHTEDRCFETTPADSEALYNSLSALTSTAYNTASGGVRVTAAGYGVTPDDCGAYDYHGYLGIEPTAVGFITGWLDTQVTSLSGNSRPEDSFATIACAGMPVQLELSTLTRDVDGDSLTYSITHTVTSLGGNVNISGSTVTYTPPANAGTKTDYFVYVVTDGHGGVNAAVVTVLNGSYKLTASSGGTGSGILSSATSGVSCGDNVCTSILNDGAIATITAAASAGSIFVGWSGCDTVNNYNCSVTMNAAKSVTATFSLNTELLTATSAGSGSGIVTSSVGSINYSYPTTGPCSDTAMLDYDTSVMLTAIADATSTVVWSGNCDSTGGSSTAATCLIASMNASKTVKATFTSSGCLTQHVMNKNTSVYYDSIANGYSAAESNNSILMHSVIFTGDLLLNNPDAVSLYGGYDCNYSTNLGLYTTINGKVTITGGKVIAEKIKIK